MMDFSIFRPQNLSKFEPIYAYKRYAYKKTCTYILFRVRESSFLLRRITKDFLSLQEKIKYNSIFICMTNKCVSLSNGSCAA